MPSLQSHQLIVNLTPQGLLSVSRPQMPESALLLQLLPLQHEMETSFPYQETRLTKSSFPIAGRQAPASLPQVFWDIRQTDSSLEVEYRIHEQTVSQRITLDDGRCRIETFLHVKPEAPIPTSIELYFTGLTGLWSQSRMLLLRGSMGHNQIKPANQAIVGEHAISPWTLQVENHAANLYSDSGSAHPLKWVRGEQGWHGMVMLAPEMDPGKHSIGHLNIEFHSCGQELLERYAERFASPKAAKPSPKCWNSWDYFHSSISHEKIMECTRALADDPVMKQEIDTIALDMGWEIRHGEWTADSYFPKGMKAMADDIRSAGFQAGLWFAPIIIDPECNVFQDNYDFVAKNRFGFPDRAYECCGLFGYILDVTSKEGEAFLFNLFREYRSMGYTYFKLDFLRYMMYVGRYQNGKLTHIQVMQRALQIIRDAVGEESYILGCNLPLDVGAGYTDATRVTSDVAVFWESIHRNALSLCTTYFFNRKWWENDPDFLVVRGKETFSPNHNIYRTWWFPRQDQFSPENQAAFTKRLSRDGTISLEEARVHASLEMLLGGSLVLGDPYQHLNEEAREILKKVVGAPTAPGKPIGIFNQDLPASIWIQEMPGLTRIGLFNWQDTPSRIRLNESSLEFPLSGLQAQDFWNGEILSLAEDVTFDLPPRSCRVLELEGKGAVC